MVCLVQGVRTFKLSVSFLEIYNEDIKDLLDPRADHTSSFSQRHNGRFGSAPEGQRSLQLREEAGGVVVMGLKEVCTGARGYRYARLVGWQSFTTGV